jgi:hypothetical protein
MATGLHESFLFRVRGGIDKRVWLRSSAAAAPVPSCHGTLVVHGGRGMATPAKAHTSTRFHILDDWLLLTLHPPGPSSQTYALVASALKPGWSQAEQSIAAFGHSLTPFLGGIHGMDCFLVAGGQTAQGTLCPLQRVGVSVPLEVANIVADPEHDPQIDEMRRTCVVHAVATGGQSALAVVLSKTAQGYVGDPLYTGAWQLEWGESNVTVTRSLCPPPRGDFMHACDGSLRMFQIGDGTAAQIGLLGWARPENVSNGDSASHSKLCCWQVESGSAFRNGAKRPRKMHEAATKTALMSSIASPFRRRRPTLGGPAEERPRCLLPLQKASVCQKGLQPPGCAFLPWLCRSQCGCLESFALSGCITQDFENPSQLGEADGSGFVL